MKKILLLSMLGIMFISESLFAVEMKSCPNPPTGVWIKIMVNLHRPKLDCERGFGICFAVSWGLEERPILGSEQNLCSMRGQINELNQLVLEVDETVLSKYEGGAALPYFKDKTSISILDPYTLPEATSRALGSSVPVTIKPGNYPVTFANGVYRVVFQL